MEEKPCAAGFLVIDEPVLSQILSFLRRTATIPKRISEELYQRQYEGYACQLRGKSILPAAIPRLRRALENRHYASLIHPGSSVGIELGQSLGERQSQSLLNSFHTSGLSRENHVNLFGQILNCSNVKGVHTVFFNKTWGSVGDARRYCSRRFVGHSLKNLVCRTRLDSDIASAGGYPEWQALYAMLNGRNHDPLDGCSGGRVSLIISPSKLLEYELPLNEICDAIESQYREFVCVPSPLSMQQIDIYVKYPADIDTASSRDRFLKVCLHRTLLPMRVSGISGITESFFAMEDCGRVSATLYNGSFRDILCHPLVDITRTYTTSLWELLDIFGVEATRAYLVHEMLTKVVPGVSCAHVLVLVEQITHGGSLSSISRYSMRVGKGSVLARASFEETADHFSSAGVFGMDEPIESVSASIIVAKLARIGTGSVGLSVDLDMIGEGC
jgi:DNA-directed RNA polymerase II subunit RPB1